MTHNRGHASMSDETGNIANKADQSQGQESSPNNFAEDRQKASEAGKKGGSK
jgi:general stress protein YciG